MASSARIDEIKKKFDENPRRYFAPLANEFRKAGDLEQAIIICEEFLGQQAGHMSGHIVYGQALFESGRLGDARTVFETALALDPENLIALRHLGDIARAQGDPASARQWYDRVLEADPRNEEIQQVIAELVGGPAGAAAAADPDATVVMEAVTVHGGGPAPEFAAVELDMDADFGTPPAPATAPMAPSAAAPYAPPAADEPPFDALSLDGLEPTHAGPAAAPTPAAGGARAEGLEPTEFEAPTTRHERAPGLEPSEFEAPAVPPARAEGFQSTEFEAPSPSSMDESLLDLDSSFSSSAPSGVGTPAGGLAGLEPTGATQPPPPAAEAFPALDFDEAPPAAASTAPAAPPRVEDPRMDPPAAMEAMPALEMEPTALDTAAAAGSTQAERSVEGLPMMELTPAVIAAESQLMEAGASYDQGAAPREDAAPAPAPPFVTETMAELYLKQGFREQALDVYRQLASAAPGDARLRARVAELEQPAHRDGEPAAGGDTVRSFFFRLATRRPGERATQSAPPSTDDFAAFETSPVPATAVALPPVEAPRAPAPVPDESWEVLPEVAAPAERTPAYSADLPFLTDEPAPAAPAPESSIDLPFLTDDVEPPRQVDAEASSAGAMSSHDPAPAREPKPEPEPEPVAEPVAVADVPAAPQVESRWSRDPEPEPQPAQDPIAAAMSMSSGTERGATAQGGPATAGTIDALFGTRGAVRSDDSAVSALAQAFGGPADTPALMGRPARAAAQELSLDSVFRDGPARPPRASQSFSYDQFFSDGAAPADGAASRPSEPRPTGEPAERSADDIEQFNSWLQGLKQR